MKIKLKKSGKRRASFSIDGKMTFLVSYKHHDLIKMQVGFDDEDDIPQEIEIEISKIKKM